MFRISIVLLFLLCSLKAFAGGGSEPYTRADAFEDFNNPNLPLQDGFNYRLLRSLIQESEWYVSYDWNSGPDLGGKSFSSYLDSLLITNGRENSRIKLKTFNRESWSDCTGSKARSGVIDLVNLLAKDESVSDEQLKAILLARFKIAIRCDSNTTTDLSFANNQDLPESWASYFTALDVWFKKDYLNAAADFENLSKLSEGTVSSFSKYMAARGYMVAAQQDWKPWQGKIQSSFLKNTFRQVDTSLTLHLGY